VSFVYGTTVAKYTGDCKRCKREGVHEYVAVQSRFASGALRMKNEQISSGNTSSMGHCE
jgi:hypothetical protein